MMQRNTTVAQRSTKCAANFVNRANSTSGRMTTAMSKVTAAERRVLCLVSLAKTNKEIAVVLGISPATVKRHLENVLRKLELKNRVEAAIYGLIANGCPNGSSSACPLALWRKAKHDAEPKWAV